MPCHEFPIFCSLGMFIIDEIEYPKVSGKPLLTDLIGGAGPYAIAGARIASGRQNSKLVAGIIDRGNDFPPKVEKEFIGWDCSIKFRSDNKRATTRGRNIYNDDGTRDFIYLSPKVRIEAEDILEDNYLSKSRTFHLICSLERCESIIDMINKNSVGFEPIFIYEPLPDICTPDNFEALAHLLPKIHVFSPNLEEASRFANMKKPDNFTDIGHLSDKFFSFLKKTNSGVVIRCGALGCYIQTKLNTFSIPAYHSTSDMVVDETGAGNSFCGAFITSFYLSDGNWEIASICGTVVSGCLIEQLGTPSLTRLNTEENWNSKSFKERLSTFLKRNHNTTSLDIADFNWI